MTLANLSVSEILSFQMTAFMTLKREQSEELPNNNEKILQHYVEKMGDLIAVSDEGVSENNFFT